MRTITLTLTGFTAQVFTLADTATAQETRAAIQQALDLAGNATAGGKVELSEGIYVVAPGDSAGDGALRAGSNTEFAGAGLGLTQIRLDDNPTHDVTGIIRTASGRTLPDGTPQSTHDVLIRDLTIDGNNANTGTALVDGFFCGPKPFTELSIDTNIRLDRVEVCNVSRYGFDPHERTDNLTFANCVSHGNGLDGFTIDYCNNVQLIDCEAYGNGRHGVNVVTSSYGVTITNIKAHDNGSTGITVQTGNFEIRELTHNVVITGGTVTDNAADGIVVRQAENVTIGGTLNGDGITVSGNGRFGILIEGGSGVNITGNAILDNAGGGTGSDSSEIRVRGYLQTHLDADPLNDMFEASDTITISNNQIGSVSGIVHDYGASYSDTTAFTFTDDNNVVFLAMRLTEGQAKTATSAALPVITSGDDTISGTDGGDSITGESGNDTIYGLAGNDKLYGADGNDALDGGSGADTLTGGFGNDTYWADASDVIAETALAGTDEVKTRANTFSIAAFANVEKLTFAGTGDFTGTGNGSANTLTGGSGADLLNGGGGIDTMNGGAGNDTYFVDTAGDVLLDTGGLDTVRAAISFTLGAAYENLVLTAAGVTGHGNEANNTITGSTGAEKLFGAGGNDRLVGGAGSDTLDGGAGNDTFVVDSFFDSVSDSAGIDIVETSVTYYLGAGIEKLTLTGTAALDGGGNMLDNVLHGNAGANLLEGFSGNDTLDGGLGRDTLSGGDGSDIYIIERSDEVAYDTGGIDRVTASASYVLGTGLDHLVLVGTATLNGTGNSLANAMTGNAAANTLSGLLGNDVLNGGGGSDILTGGAGRDVLTGGSGADRFLFDTAANALTNIDRITDFSVVYDTIALARSAFTAFKFAGTLATADFVRGTAAADASDHIIYNAATGAITYDSNGNAAGGATVIAYVATGLSLTHADFLIV